MRSSKSRSRNKNNRRPSGNVINRVFDSSGPEGKVRGTPQQIIDKYNSLARDAQLSGDRVAVESFQQHAEHYTRMLGEAMREQNERREMQDAQQAAQNGHASNGQGDTSAGPDSALAEADQAAGGRQRSRQDRGERPDRKTRSVRDEHPEKRLEPATENATSAESADAASGLEMQVDAESNLIETPESKPPRKPRAQRARKPRAPTEEVVAPTSKPEPAAATMPEPD